MKVTISCDTGRFTGCGFKTLLLSAGKCHNLPLMALLRAIAACYVILFMGLNISLMVRLANVKAISLLIAILILTRVYFVNRNSLVECALTASQNITGKHPDEMRCEAWLRMFIAAGRHLVLMTLRWFCFQRDTKQK